MAIALGVLAVNRLIPNRPYTAIGELGLDGALHSNPEYLALLDNLSSQGRVYTSADVIDRSVGPLVSRAIYPANSLRELYLGLSGSSCLLPLASVVGRPKTKSSPLSSENLTISKQLLRALALSLAGGHHLLLFGSPGVGKTYSRSMLPILLPEETEAQVWERQVRESIGAFSDIPPGRIVAPHHSATLAGLIGGGRPVRAGAITLAHRGILFLDELPEFSRACLEALRQPLENERLTLVRGGGAWTLPCSFTMIATANPCPCGFYGTDKCDCRDSEVKRYVEQISGPVLDRIDLQVRVSIEDRVTLSPIEVVVWREKITAARRKQEARVKDGLPEYCRLYEKTALQQLGGYSSQILPGKLTKYWSLRRKLKLWRVARTIADLEDCQEIKAQFVREAYQLVRPAFKEIISDEA